MDGRTGIGWNAEESNIARKSRKLWSAISLTLDGGNYLKEVMDDRTRKKCVFKLSNMA